MGESIILTSDGGKFITQHPIIITIVRIEMRNAPVLIPRWFGHEQNIGVSPATSTSMGLRQNRAKIVHSIRVVFELFEKKTRPLGPMHEKPITE
ncbi:hypothetical protein ABEB36_002872 [Hypothenemus hampei]|uniref:Uncharacterized protein n=1 Tax=Hypothenemus hampei TaxID=57062 RepID=A0ABD1FAY4_HYPHA